MKIICIGRNYAEHIKELQNAVPATPVFFLKPDTALLIRNRPFYYPAISTEIHHEVELVLKISKTGKSISKRFASNYYEEIGIGLDMTARDLQDQAKSKGLPWAAAKGFDQSAPVSRFLPKILFKDKKNINFRLDLNGRTVQQGNSGMMLFDFETLISHVSTFMTLRAGDYLFTGTPAGVGPVKIGDVMEAYLESDLMLKCQVR